MPADFCHTYMPLTPKEGRSFASFSRFYGKLPAFRRVRTKRYLCHNLLTTPKNNKRAHLQCSAQCATTVIILNTECNAFLPMGFGLCRYARPAVRVPGTYSYFCGMLSFSLFLSPANSQTCPDSPFDKGQGIYILSCSRPASTTAVARNRLEQQSLRYPSLYGAERRLSPYSGRGTGSGGGKSSPSRSPARFRCSF